MPVISGPFSVQMSLSVKRQWKTFWCEKFGYHEMLSSAEPFLEEINLTGKLEVGFNITSLKKQNNVNSLHIPQIWLRKQMYSMASQDHWKSWRSRQLASALASQKEVLGTWEYLTTGHHTNCWNPRDFSCHAFHEARCRHKRVSFPICEGVFWPICGTLTFLKGPMNLLRSLQHFPNGTRLLFIVL